MASVPSRLLVAVLGEEGTVSVVDDRASAAVPRKWARESTMVIRNNDRTAARRDSGAPSREAATRRSISAVPRDREHRNDRRRAGRSPAIGARASTPRWCIISTVPGGSVKLPTVPARAPEAELIGPAGSVSYHIQHESSPNAVYAGASVGPEDGVASAGAIARFGFNG